MSEMIRTAKEVEAMMAAQKVLDCITAKFSPVMAYPDGALLVYVDGLEVKFRFVSVEEMST